MGTIKRGITITSDGTPGGTKVANANGDDIKGVISVDTHIEVEKLMRATIELRVDSFEATVGSKQTKFVVRHPWTGKATEISGFVLKDGTELNLLCEPPLGNVEG